MLKLSRPQHLFGVSVTLEVSPLVRPQRAIDALEQALNGCRSLLATPAPSVSIRKAGGNAVEYELNGFVASMGEKREVRNQLFDLAFRHLQAAGISLLSLPEAQAFVASVSGARAVLGRSSLFATLSDEEKDSLGAQMQRSTFKAGQVLLAPGQVSEELLIIESGVISVTLPQESGSIEAGRMGPGEVIGEAGILTHTAWQAQFAAVTDGSLYRIDQKVMEPCLEARQEIAEAMTRLLDYRIQASQALLVEQPTMAQKRGVLDWLRRLSLLRRKG
ncbi:Cyclic nucleotide-binding domain protein [compost metagenome]